MPGSVIAYTGNDVAINNILLNTIDAGCIWTVSDIDGWWGLPEATAPDSPRSVYEDGSTPVAGRYLSRKLKLTGTIVPSEPNVDGQAFSVAARNAFNRALNLIRTQGILQVNGDPAKMAYVQVVDRPLMNMSKQNDVLTFEISLRASDPRKYDISETTFSTTGYLGNIGRSYDKVYDFSYGSAGSSGLINAYNEGTYNTFGKIVIHGPVIDPVIEHVTSGSRLSFDIDLAIGQSLEIDLAVHTVILNGGANRRTSLLPISKWFSLMPGDNFIKFSGTQDPLPQHATKDRVNLLPNPNATSGTTTGWQMRTAGDALTVSTFPGVPGDNVFFAANAVGSSDPEWGVETTAATRPSVTAFDIYAFSLNIRKRNAVDPNAPSTRTLMSANISWYDLNGTLIRTHEGTAWAVASDHWVRMSSVAQAPSGAVKASVFVRPTQYNHYTGANTSQGFYIDDLMLEKVLSQGDVAKNIATNGNLTRDSSNWTQSDTGNPILTFDRTWFKLDASVGDPNDELELSDWYAQQYAENHNTVTGRSGYKYAITTGFTPGEEYTFSANVRSTIDQNWAIKVKALTSGGVAITGTDGSSWITQGTSTYVAADEWYRLSSIAVVPSGAASLQVYVEPANGVIYAINTITNPGFERTAEAETALNAVTFSDEFGQYSYGREIVTNHAVYPDGKGISSFPNYWSVGSFGAGGAGTITSVTTGGYLNGNAVRKAWTTAPTTPATAADLGLVYTVTPNVSWGALTNRPPVSVRAWVTASKTSNQQIAIEFINASSTTVSTWVGPAVSIGTSGGWIVAENLNTGVLNWVTLRLHIGPYAAGFTPAIADYITGSGLMVEFSATSHIYFSGSAADTWDKTYTYKSLPGGPTATLETAQVKYRENLAYNPRPTSSSLYWVWQNGPGGAATLTTVTNEVGPTDQYGFRRATITTIDTGGSNQGHVYRQDGTYTGVIGDKHMSSMWVRYSTAASITPQVAYRLAGATSGTVYTGAPVAVAANVWTRLSVPSTATAAYDGMQMIAYEQAAGPAVGATIDATGVLIERDYKVDVVTNLVNDPSFENSSGSTLITTNIFTDPEALGLTQFESNAGMIDISNISGFNLSPSATRATRTTAGAGRVSMILGTAFLASTTYTILAKVRSSNLLTNVAVNYRINASSSTSQVTVATISIPAGVSTIRLTGTRNAAAALSNAAVTLVWSSGTVGDTLDITDIAVVPGTYTGPYFDGDTPPINFINQATNPGMEATSGTVETRRNLSTHPTSPVYVTGTTTNLGWGNGRWFGGGINTGTYTNVTNATDGPEPGITSYARKTWTVVSGTSSGDIGFGTNTWTGMVAGAVYTVSGWMRTSMAARTAVGFDASWNDASGQVSRSNLAFGTLLPNIWQKFSGTFTVPPTGVTSGSFVLDTDSGTAMTVGATIDVTGLLVEQVGVAGTVQRTNLHTNPSVARNTNNWSVAAGGGTYTVTRETTLGATTGSLPFGSAQTWYKMTCTAVNTTSPIGMYTQGNTIATGASPVTAGQSYILSAYHVSSVNSSGTVRLNWNWVDAAGATVGATGASTNVANTPNAWQRLASTAQVAPAGAVGVRVVVFQSGVPALTVGEFMGATAVMVEQTTTVGSYFDGSVVGSATTDYDWTGTPHNSTSVVRTAPTGPVKPYFDGLVQPALRINLHPIPGTSATTLVGVSNLTAQSAGTISDAPFTGTTFRRLTAGPTPATGDGFDSSSAVASAPRIRQPGTYVYSVWLRASDALSVRPTLIHAAAVGAVVVSAPDVALLPGVWTRATITATLVTPGALGFRIRGLTGGGTIPTGGTLDIGGFLCEMTTDTNAPYFDGSTAQPAGFTASWYGTVDASPSYIWDADLPSTWTGTAFASASILSGAGVTGTTSGTTVYGISSTQWAASGTKSLRQSPRSINGDAYTVVAATVPGGGGSGGIALLELGKTYTVVATLRQAAPAIGTAHSNGSRQITVIGSAPWVTTKSTQGTNAAGVYQHRVTFTVPSTVYGQVRLYHGYKPDQDQVDIWWDNVAVIEGDYPDGYFDGSNATLGLNAAWTGTADASSSYLYNPATYDPSWTTAWTGTAKASTSTVSSPNSLAVSSVVNAQALISSEWSAAGTKSLRIRPTTASNDSYAVIASDAAARMLAQIADRRNQGRINNNYDISVTTRRAVDATGSLNFRDSELWVRHTRASTGATVYEYPVYTLYGGNADDAGVHKAYNYFYFYSDTDSIEFRAYNGASVDNGDIWYDALIITQRADDEVERAVPYFDGSSSPVSGYSFEWSGAANGSPSNRYLSSSPVLLPYFDGDTRDNKELYRNLVPYANPQSTTGWNVQAGTGGSASIAYNTGAGVAANGFVRGTWTTGTTAPSTGAIFSGSGQTNKPVPASTALSAGIWVRPSVDLNFYLQVNFYNSSGTYISSPPFGPTTFCPANKWTLVKAENFVSPAGTYAAAMYAMVASNIATGTTIDADQAMLVAASTLPPYFDGAVSNVEGAGGAWLGTAYTSQSVLLGEGDASNWWSTNNAATEPSVQTYPRSNLSDTSYTNENLKTKGVIAVGSNEYTQNARQGSLRLVPTADTNDTYADFHWDDTILPASDSKSYTLFATVVIDKAQTGTLNDNARRFAWIQDSPLWQPEPYSVVSVSDQIPNVPGRYTIKWTTTNTTGTPNFLRLYNGASKGNGDIWLERFSIVAGTTYDAVDPYYAANMGSELYQTDQDQQATLISRTGVSEIYRNNVQNPHFAYLGAVEPNVTRINMLTDPRGTASTTTFQNGWTDPSLYFNGSLVRSFEKADGPEGRQEFIRLSNTPGIDPQYMYNAAIEPTVYVEGQTFKVGEVYTFSVWVRLAQGGAVSLHASLIPPGGGYSNTDANSDIQMVVPNVWTRLYVTFMVREPYSETQVLPTVFLGSLLFEGGSNSATQKYDYGSAMLEKSDKALPYFDGSMETTPAYLRGWMGGVNTSQSVEVQSGSRVLRQNLHLSPTTFGQIGDAAGTVQWEIFSNAGGAGGFISGTGTSTGLYDYVYTFTVGGTGSNSAVISTRKASAPAIPVVPFTEYAYSVDIGATIALPTGSRADIQWLDKNNTVISTAIGATTPITVANRYERRSITSVAPSGAVFARPLVTFPNAGSALVNNTRIGGTNALFEKANYVDTFFSGSAPISGSLNTVAWNGVRNASSSSLIDSRLTAVRTNYAIEAVPPDLASTNWVFTPNGGSYNETYHSSPGPNEVPGMLGAQVLTSPGVGVPYVWSYTSPVSGIAGDIYTGGMAYRITASNTSGTINATLTYKLAGSVVNSASAATIADYSIWRQVYTPAVAATGTFDEIVVSLTTAIGPNNPDKSYVTQALIEKTTQQLPWFSAAYPDITYSRVNRMGNPSFESANIGLASTIDNRAANSGPFGTLTGTGTWSALPPLGATVNTQMVQAAGDTHPHASPNYVRSVYATAATVTGDKGTEYVNGYGSAQFGTGAFYVEMYVRSSAALPARLLITSETGVNTVVATSAANTGVNLVPNQWTRLYGTVATPGTHTKVRVKALIGSASASLPVSTTFDVSSVLITANSAASMREYNDKNLPDSDFRDYQPNNTYTQASLYRNPYGMNLQKNMVLDPTIQYGGADWMLTPGWGIGGNGTRTIELGKGLGGGYSLMRRWTATPSNSTAVSGVGSGYLFKAGVTGRPYSFTALYSASKASSADAWVTWYTDATLSSVVSSTLLSSVAYETSGTSVFIRGEGAVAPATAGFGLFSVGTWGTGFNPTLGDWTSVSNMRIDEGLYLSGQYFDVHSLTGTDMRYQVTGVPGASMTNQMGAYPRSIQWWSAIAAIDTSWSLTGQHSLRVAPSSTTSNASMVELMDINTSGRAVDLAPYDRTFTLSATIRVGPEGHKGAMNVGARTLAIGYNSTMVYSNAASASANNTERLSVTATVPAGATSVTMNLINGGYIGAGDIWFDDVLLEETSALGDYFDGNTTNAPAGQVNSWLGTPNASYSITKLITDDYVGVLGPKASYLVGAKPYSVEPYDGYVATQSIRGAAASPSSFVRVANFVNSSNDVYATVGGGAGALRLGMQAGRTYTALGTVMLETVQTGTLHANARSLVVYYRTASTPGTYQSFVSSQAPNATGSYNLRKTFTLPTDTTEAFLALYSGSANGQDRLYWTNVALVPYTYTGPYFDGHSASWAAGETPGWVGAVDASVSVVTGGYPSHVYPTNARVVQSPSWAASGVNSLKIIPIDGEESYAVVRDELGMDQWGSPFMPTTATTPRTIMATFHIEDTQIGTLSPYARSIAVVNSTTGAVSAIAQAPNVSGTYQLTATIPGNYALREIRLYNGSTAASGAPVWWDNFGAFYVPAGLTVPGTPAYSGPYFDGSTEAADGVSYTWIDDSASSISLAMETGAGFIWPEDSKFYADKISAITGGSSAVSKTSYWDGRTTPSNDVVYYYTGGDEASVSYAQTTEKPAVDTYFDGNTGGAFWNGAANNSSSTLPGLTEIPEAVMDITYRSAWIE